MRVIAVDLRRLLRYTLFSLSVIMLIALVIYYAFWGENDQAVSPFMAMRYSVMLLIFGLSWLLIPLLIMHGVFHLMLMLKDGRRPGVGLFDYRFLFNPINLLIYPSLLTAAGIYHRRRCLTALFLFGLLLFQVWWIAGTAP